VVTPTRQRRARRVEPGAVAAELRASANASNPIHIQVAFVVIFSGFNLLLRSS
jgi:hypothetical protein